MNIKDLLRKLGILKVGATAGTYKNAEGRSNVVTDEPIDNQTSESPTD